MNSDPYLSEPLSAYLKKGLTMHLPRRRDRDEFGGRLVVALCGVRLNISFRHPSNGEYSDPMFYPVCLRCGAIRRGKQ